MWLLVWDRFPFSVPYPTRTARRGIPSDRSGYSQCEEDRTRRPLLATALATALAAGTTLLAGCGSTTDDASSDAAQQLLGTDVGVHHVRGAPLLVGRVLGSHLRLGVRLSAAPARLHHRRPEGDARTGGGRSRQHLRAGPADQHLRAGPAAPAASAASRWSSPRAASRSAPGRPHPAGQREADRAEARRPRGRDAADHGGRATTRPRSAAPTPTQGLRVYPPNETHAAYVPHRATGCESTAVHLLELRPYQAG